MSTQRLTCPQGHTWDHSGSGQLPADLSEICPVCEVSDQQTLEHPSAADTSDSQDSSDLLPNYSDGQLYAGFEIQEELRRGGMGVIYKARQQGLNRIVALKVISPERLNNRETLERFKREVQAAALLSHPNIVTVYQTDLEGPNPYLAMEFVQGIDLLRLVKQVGPPSVPDTCLYIRQACDGLQHAHDQGLVHRDIKPANLMVTPSPLDKEKPHRKTCVKILDLGLARMVDQVDPDTNSELTKAGQYLGTPDYIAPEQAEDARKADIRSDLYSLGCTTYFLLTGEVPFPGLNAIQKLRLQLLHAPPSARAKLPEIPIQLDKIVQRAMAPDPADRYQTPHEFKQAIEDFLRNAESREEPPQKVLASPPTPEKKLRGDRQTYAHEGGVLALALSSDGTKLLTGGLDETIRVWNAENLQEIMHITEDVGPVHSVCFAPGNKWMASCSLRLMREDMVVQLWDMATGQQRRRLRGHSDNVRCVVVASNGRRLASGSADNSIRIWALDQPKTPSQRLQAHSGEVTCILFLPGGGTVVSGGEDNFVRLWETATGEKKGELNPQVGPITALAFTLAKQRLAIAGEASLCLRQSNGKLLRLRGHRGPALCVSFSPDGKRLLSGGSDRTVRLWRVEDGASLGSFEKHDGKVHGVAFSTDGRGYYSVSADGTIRYGSLPD
ncbi:MAG: WD40 repeat domain-containing serine/threonine protein kinase [Gemmataceae bacterium]